MATSLIICASVWAQEARFSFPTNSRFVLSPKVGALLLQQCSRAVLDGITQFWRPTDKEIDALESRLKSYLTERRREGHFVPPRDITYHRQYVGIVRDGVKLIYGNFYPGGKPQKDEYDGPAIVCDGGPSRWGIVFDPATEKFEEPQFNGVA